MAFECSECGAEVGESDEYCPGCGTPFTDANDPSVGGPGAVEGRLSSLSEKQLMLIGGASGVISFGLFPPLFGIVSILCGAKLFRDFDQKMGAGIVILGVLGLVIGMAIGAETFT